MPSFPGNRQRHEDADEGRRHGRKMHERGKKPGSTAMRPTTYERLRRAAVKTVETCPGVEAVLLFGSRARGTPHPHSDWDVAVLSRADPAGGQDACRFLGKLERVNPVFLTPESIEENRDRAPRLEAAIARQGRLLAGAWTRPPCRTEHLEMEPEDFRGDLEIAIRDIENAVAQLCNAFLDGDDYVPNLVELSQQAAEGVAKSIVAGHGLVPIATHELNELAAQLENAYRGRRGGAARRLFARAIRELNGNARAAHGARYDREPVEELADTVERLLRVQRLQIRWIRSCAEQHPDMRAPARALGKRIARAAGRLGRREGFDGTSPAVQAETRHWGEEGESLAEGAERRLTPRTERFAGAAAFAELLYAGWAWGLPRSPQMLLGRIAVVAMQQLSGVRSDGLGVQFHVHDKRSFFGPFWVSECFAGGVNRLRVHAVYLRPESYRDVLDGKPSLGMEPLDHTSQDLVPSFQCLFPPVPESDGGRAWRAGRWSGAVADRADGGWPGGAGCGVEGFRAVRDHHEDVHLGAQGDVVAGP